MTPHDSARVVLEADVRGGLTRRTVLASAVLALLVGAMFVVLIRAVAEERDSADQAIQSQEVIAAANRLERLVLDLETGQRGYVITHDERFLQPWENARDAYPALTDALETDTGGGVNGQADAAREITAAIDGTSPATRSRSSTRRDEATPPPPASRRSTRASGASTTLRARVRRVRRRRAARFVTREEGADDDAQRALIIAAVGLAASTLLIACSART